MNSRCGQPEQDQGLLASGRLRRTSAALRHRHLRHVHERLDAVMARHRGGVDRGLSSQEGDVEQLAALLADAEIVLGHIWLAGFPRRAL